MREFALKGNAGYEPFSICRHRAATAPTAQHLHRLMFVAAAAGRKGGHMATAASLQVRQRRRAWKRWRPNRMPPQQWRCARQTGIGFMYAPLHHPAMSGRPVRRGMGVRTIFNPRPLTKPGRRANILMGVFHPDLVGISAGLQRLGAQRRIVVWGKTAWDDLARLRHPGGDCATARCANTSHPEISASPVGQPHLRVENAQNRKPCCCRLDNQPVRPRHRGVKPGAALYPPAWPTPSPAGVALARTRWPWPQHAPSWTVWSPHTEAEP